mmetsp:Transcript_7794/g.11763  ORF Transcript_7794/g.11763 Transcript_7794/m.11763 type:complete len:220 (-) Transcript_7794:9-668(-)
MIFNATSFLLLSIVPAKAFVSPNSSLKHVSNVRLMSNEVQIESPFSSGANLSTDDQGPLPLTLQNVETVLDEMRPYLMSDGGNVRVVEIDGPVVRLALEGACGSCPSSTMTMKMGLEKRLMEKIPEISEVVQSIPDGPPLVLEEIEKVLDGVRPFLSVAGGAISVENLAGVGGMQPSIMLKMTGKSSSLQSVKMEIMQRIQRHFMISGLRIDWKKESRI